jgi:hypothetical protein
MNLTTVFLINIFNSFTNGIISKMNEEKDFDVVIDVLEKHRAILWKMTQQNMNSDMFNVMDQIRLEQIDQLDRAIIMWENHNEQTN